MKKGFTLIELLVVIAIIGLLAAIVYVDWVDFTISEHTISFWFKADVLGGWKDLVGTRLSQDSNRFHIYAGSNRICWDRVLGTSTLVTDIVVETGIWYHVVGTHDGTTAKIYVNGKLEASANYGSSQTATGLSLGGPSEYFDGLMDNVRFFDEPLSESQIKQIYVNEGKKHNLVLK